MEAPEIKKKKKNESVNHASGTCGTNINYVLWHTVLKLTLKT